MCKRESVCFCNLLKIYWVATLAKISYGFLDGSVNWNIICYIKEQPRLIWKMYFGDNILAPSFCDTFKMTRPVSYFYSKQMIVTVIAMFHFNGCCVLRYQMWDKTSQVTYVTMVPRVGNETLRPLGDTMGNASSVTRAWRNIWKNTIRWPATAHDVTTGATTI